MTEPTGDGPETVICTFRVKPERLAEFEILVSRHWPLLRRLELATDTPERLLVSVDDGGSAPVVVSIYEWVSGEAAGRAHQHPDVAEIWEAMEPMCEARDGRPSMDFPHFRPLVGR